MRTSIEIQLISSAPSLNCTHLLKPKEAVVLNKQSDLALVTGRSS